MEADFPGALHTWTDVINDTDIISGAHMNSAHAEIIAIEQNLFDLGQIARVYRNTSSQTIARNSLVKIQWNAASFDDDSLFDISSDYYFTPTKSGYYHMIFQTTLLGYEVGKVVALYLRQGSTTISKRIFEPKGTAEFDCHLSDYVNLTADTDYQFMLFHTCSTAKTLGNGEQKSFACMKRVY